MNDRMGQHLGNYRLLDRLGIGGFAEVYLGEHIYLKWQAAIKVLPMRLSNEEMESFSTEARTIAGLKHPNIISVLDFGIQDSTSTPYLVMDYAPNGTLRQRLSRGKKLSSDTMLSYVKQVAEALQYAHDNRTIHRDVKPENILLDKNNNVLLSDFGLATVMHSTQNQPSQKNMGVGTIAYTAPEQNRNKPCYASDQYSLGIIVYEMLCGVRPFNGTAIEVTIQHRLNTPPSMRDHVPLLSPAIETVVQKALAKDPRRRFPTIRDFAQALEKSCQLVKQDHRTVPGASTGHVVIAPVDDVRTPSAVATPPQDSSVIWNVPYRRNPFFTGREPILTLLHEKFHSGKASTLVQAISGLAGGGKTQLAVEYAYRHHRDYTVILWLRGDKRDALREDWNMLATQLRLPIKEKGERVADTVKSWLKTHTRWLLILDNDEDLTLLHTLVPSNVHGHILLTTRTQTTGSMAQRVDLCNMVRDEAILFLLRRTKRLSQDALLMDARPVDRKKANEIAALLGDHVLALDQAGAYIEETGCSIDDYLCLYSTSRAQLLNMRGGLGVEHAASVRVTFVHSFEKVAQIRPGGPAALELLYFCAFLDASAIPEELIRYAASELGTILQPVANDALLLDAAIALLRKYSLVNRVSETKLLSLHPLVQVVLQDWMSEKIRSEWVARTVRAVNTAFPDIEEVQNWHRCQQAIPHVQACITLITQYNLHSVEAARLLYQAGFYFRIQAQYDKAEALLASAVAMLRTIPEPKEVATDFRTAFWRHHTHGIYGEAKSQLQKELTHAEHVLGPAHLHVATVRLKLAELYYKQGRYDDAENLFLQSLSIKAQNVDLMHPCVACNFNGLGLIYFTQGKYPLAQSYFLHALSIWENLPEPQHPFMGGTLGALARLAITLGKYDAAETYLHRERVHLELTLQPLHPALAASFNDWAILCMAQGRYDQVEILLDSAQAILVQTVGLKHASAARVLYTRAQFYALCGKYIQAEQLLQEVLSIREQAFGFQHPDVASTVNMLADVYVAQRRYGLADELYKQALEIRESILGTEHPDVAQTLNGMAGLSFIQTAYEDAEYYYIRALAIREKVFGVEHPDVAQTLNDLAKLHSNRKRFEKAEPLFRRALAIREKTSGSMHLEVGTSAKSFVLTLWAMNKREEATEWLKRAKQIREKYAYLYAMDD